MLVANHQEDRVFARQLSETPEEPFLAGAGGGETLPCKLFHELESGLTTLGKGCTHRLKPGGAWGY